MSKNPFSKEKGFTEKGLRSKLFFKKSLIKNRAFRTSSKYINRWQFSRCVIPNL
jgi:hypothetical protein